MESRGLCATCAEAGVGNIYEKLTVCLVVYSCDFSFYLHVDPHFPYFTWIPLSLDYIGDKPQAQH